MINLLELLFDSLSGVKNQDDLVEQVKNSAFHFHENFKIHSQGLNHLLNKWDVLTDSARKKSLGLVLHGSEGEEASKRMVALTDEMSAQERSDREERKKKKELDW